MKESSPEAVQSPAHLGQLLLCFGRATGLCVKCLAIITLKEEIRISMLLARLYYFVVGNGRVVCYEANVLDASEDIQPAIMKFSPLQSEPKFTEKSNSGPRDDEISTRHLSPPGRYLRRQGDEAAGWGSHHRTK